MQQRIQDIHDPGHQKQQSTEPGIHDCVVHGVGWAQTGHRPLWSGGRYPALRRVGKIHLDDDFVRD